MGVKEISRIFGAMLAVAIMTTAACTSERLSIYPANWPALVEASSCRLISGRFENAASATTGYESPVRPEVGRAYLSRILSDGTAGALDATHAGIAGVLIDADASKVWALSADRSSESPLKSSGQWACESNGQVSLRFEAPVQSEEGNSHRTISLSLQAAADGSLIMHRVINFRGVYYGIVPGAQQEDDWLQFRRLD